MHRQPLVRDMSTGPGHEQVNIYCHVRARDAIGHTHHNASGTWGLLTKFPCQLGYEYCLWLT